MTTLISTTPNQPSSEALAAADKLTLTFNVHWTWTNEVAARIIDAATGLPALKMGIDLLNSHHEQDHEQIDQLKAECAAKDAELVELKGWKESAMTVLNHINLQEIGKILGLPLGSDIAKHILPALAAKDATIKELLAALKAP